MQDNPRDADIERQLEVWAASPPDTVASPALRQKVHDTLASSLTPVKPLPSQGVLIVPFLTVFAASAVALIAILSKAGFHLMTGVQMGLMATLLTGGGVLFSISVVRQMVPGSRQAMPFSSVLGLSGVLLTAGIALLFPWRTSGAFISEGWPCAAMELIIALPATIIFWLLARRGALFASGGLGAALTGLAVFLALTPLQFQCMFQQAPHLMVWHAGPGVLLIGLGALVGWVRSNR
jgi:hypothetical protein